MRQTVGTIVTVLLTVVLLAAAILAFLFFDAVSDFLFHWIVLPVIGILKVAVIAVIIGAALVFVIKGRRRRFF